MRPINNPNAMLELLREMTGKKPKAAATRIKEACKELYRNGWKSLSISYSGSGDSCDSFEATISNEEDELELKTAPLPPGVSAQELENDLWELLPPGFENNEGGDGKIEINTKTGKIKVEHDEYYTESRHISETY